MAGLIPPIFPIFFICFIVLLYSIYNTTLQVSSAVKKLTKDTHQAIVLSQTHIPNKISWDSAVRRALDMINRKNSVLIKVVYLDIHHFWNPWFFLQDMYSYDSHQKWRLNDERWVTRAHNFFLEATIEVLNVLKLLFFSSFRKRVPISLRSNCILFFLEIKVVLARSSRVLTTMDIDPLMWLSCLQVFRTLVI